MDKLIIYDTPQTKNRCYIKARKMTPINILVHSSGANNPWIRRYVDAPEVLGVNKYGNHWNKASATKCMHAFIGKDINGDIAVAHTLPYNVASWGCGAGSKGSYNFDPVGHIQFEICEDNLKNEAYYRAVFEVAEKYCAMLCERFAFDPMRITSHKEAADLGWAYGHGDPVHWMDKFGDSMNQFRQRVAERMGRPIELVKAGDAPVTNPTLRLNDRGEAVRSLQTQLNQLGFNAGKADGIFGVMTQEAVKQFQWRNLLHTDGVVGAKTWAALEQAMNAVPIKPEEPVDEPVSELITIALPKDVAAKLYESLKEVIT
jgi:hypothetical protein